MHQNTFMSSQSSKSEVKKLLQIESKLHRTDFKKNSSGYTPDPRLLGARLLNPQERKSCQALLADSRREERMEGGRGGQALIKISGYTSGGKIVFSCYR